MSFLANTHEGVCLSEFASVCVCERERGRKSICVCAYVPILFPALAPTHTCTHYTQQAESRDMQRMNGRDMRVLQYVAVCCSVVQCVAVCG